MLSHPLHKSFIEPAQGGSIGETPKGRGRIYIDDAIVAQSPVKIEKPATGEVQWDIMDVKDLMDTWRAFLLLPDEQYDH